MKINYISSSSNKFYKNLVSITEKSRERKLQNIFGVEGEREILLCEKAGYRPICLISNREEEFSKSPFCELISKYKALDLYCIINEELLEKLVYRTNRPLLALFEYSQNKSTKIDITDNSFFVVLEKVEKPGNLGAIARTCDAAGVDAIFVCDNQTDIFNPNVVRASLGTIFTLPIINMNSGECIDFLKKNDIVILAATVDGNLSLYDFSFKNKKVAIVVGSENDGLSKIWKDNSDYLISIPMFGKVDSINVSVATAIIVFEALRQRKFT